METEIIVAVISVLGSALGTFAGIMVNSKLTNYRIEQLENKVDKHNSVIERTIELETWKETVNREISEIKMMLNKLESFHMKG